MKVLVTGGAGYIGATIASACIDAGHVPVIVDDLSTGAEVFTAGRVCYRGDFADATVLDAVFGDHPDTAAVVHCAAHTIVPESVAEPLRYYENNVAKTLRLVEYLLEHGCDRFVFSSSGSVYAAADGDPVDEDAPLAQTSPYARTKAMLEQVLADVAAATSMRVLALRYFNPLGADPVMRTGQQVAGHAAVLNKLIGAYEFGTAFTITGTDWPTRDGTAIRDYIHVWDVAQAHVRALECFDTAFDERRHYDVLNIGTGRGTTVRELVAAFAEAAGEVAVVEGPPRPGDALGAYAVVERIRALLGWRAELTITDAIRDALAWEAKREVVLGG
jgi:UDP-glucose 4-epimerase